MDELAVFAKYWEPGQVKTRLGRLIGHERVSCLYRQFLITILRRFERAADRRTLVYSPSCRRSEFQTLLSGSGWQLHPQTDGDLGRRLMRFFDTRFADGAASVVLIGSDSPNLPRSIVDQALTALERSDVVLAPSSDGGYYLVGLRRPIPELFCGIDWSTSHVWRQTMDRLDRVSPAVQPVVLSPWYDVDTYADLERLAGDLLQGYEQSVEQDAELAELSRMCQRIVQSGSASSGERTI